MNKKLIFLFATIIIVIGAVFVYSQGLDLSTNDNLTDVNINTLDKAPHFALKDYSGKEVKLSDFNGRVVVVNSWAVWCPFCKAELSDFAKLQEMYEEEIVVIAVDRAETLMTAKNFTDSVSVTDKMIFLLDPKDTFYKSIGGFVMPETLFIDVDGNVLVHKRGPLRFEEMKQIIDDILR